MFEPYDGDVFNAFTYRGVLVRFSYRMDARDERVDQVDIDVTWDKDDSEILIARVDGSWASKEEAIAEAQVVAARMISAHLDK